MRKRSKPDPEKKEKNIQPPGYPLYPAKEDVYNQQEVESEIDPENPAKRKQPVEKTNELNEKNFEEDESGSDLDVPGSELDDAQEEVGSEDEENNLYSPGADRD